MKIKWMMITAIVFVMLCACQKNELASIFDEADVKTQAQAAIDFLNAKDYQSILDMGSTSFKESMTCEQFTLAADPILDKLGAFTALKTTVTIGQESKSNQKNYAIAVAVGAYENGNLQITMTFDENMNIIQFWIK